MPVRATIIRLCFGPNRTLLATIKLLVCKPNPPSTPAFGPTISLYASYSITKAKLNKNIMSELPMPPLTKQQVQEAREAFRMFDKVRQNGPEML